MVFRGSSLGGRRKALERKDRSCGYGCVDKALFGLFAVSASVASAIGISLAVKASGKRKAEETAHTGSLPIWHVRQQEQGEDQSLFMKNSGLLRKGGQPHRLIKSAEKIWQRQMEKTSGNYGQSKRHVQKVQTKKGARKRHAQKKHTYPDQPVWKDNNKPYVRKRRKIS